MAVDTLDYMKKLEAAGVDRKQAEAHAEALRNTVADQVATRADVVALRSDIDAKFASFESRIEAMLWKHTAGTLLGVLAIGGLLIRLLK